MQAQTVRNWMAKAGRTPADAISSADWAQLGEMARAQVQAALLSGRVRPKDAAVIAAIADRNAAKVEDAPPVSSVFALDAFVDWVVHAGHVETEDDFYGLLPELLRRANEEDGQPHRRPTLAWFSGRPEVPADGVLDWAKEQTHVILAEHGSLDGLRQWQERRRAEDHEAMLAQLERNAEAAKAWQRASLDAAAVTVGEPQ